MQKSHLDIEANRQSPKYSKIELAGRFLWSLAIPFFRWSPRTFFRWRSFLLRLFGAKIGKNVHIYNSVTIFIPWNLTIGDFSSIGEQAYIYNLGHVTIGRKATISHKAHLCAGTHDYSKKILPLIKLPIFIEDQAWICTDSYVGPGVTISEGAIVGARAVIVDNVKAWSVVAGNPARIIKDRILEG